MSVFKRSNRYVAKFQHNGAQVWVPGGPWETKRLAQEAERRHRDRLEARRTNETCESFAERWLEEWPRPEPSTRQNYKVCADQFARHFGDVRLHDVDRLTARAWALTVPRGVPRVIAVMFKDARNVGLVETNPFQGLDLPAAERKIDVRPPTMDEYRALLEGCSDLDHYGEEFRAMIQFSGWTGLRAGELYGLQWDDIGEETIWIRRARKRDGTMGKPKGGHVREIAFLAPARVLDDVPRRPDPYVFHSPLGRPLRDSSHRYSWRTVRSAAGMGKLRWHGLRHFCATQLLELGMSHFDVSVQLGHRDGGALVMQRYGHPSEAAARTRLLRAFDFDVAETGSKEVIGGAG